MIPGHNLPDTQAVSNKAELMVFRDMLVAIREGRDPQAARSLLDETIAAKPTTAFDARWGQFLITPDFLPSWSTRVYEAFSAPLSAKLRRR